MNNQNDEKSKALGELEKALLKLSKRENLSLRDKATVLQAIEKIRSEKA